MDPRVKPRVTRDALWRIPSFVGRAAGYAFG